MSNFWEKVILKNDEEYNTFFIWGIIDPYLLQKRVINVIYTELNPKIDIYIIEPSQLENILIKKSLMQFLYLIKNIVIDYRINKIFIGICDIYRLKLYIINLFNCNYLSKLKEFVFLKDLNNIPNNVLDIMNKYFKIL